MSKSSCILRGHKQRVSRLRRNLALSLGVSALCCVWGPAATARSAGLGLGANFGPRACTSLRIEADAAQCTASACVLDGHAQLRCDDDVRLTADHLEVQFGPQQSFGGAQAQGHVVLVDGSHVLRAQALVVDADQIRGRIEQATLEVRRPDEAQAPCDAATGLCTGRNALTVHGSLERLSPTRYRLREADLTLCDCGPGHLPSWRVDAPRIDVTLGERALILWPKLRINIADRWLVPVTPPLLPLSLPLRARAPGFLPPQIAFLQLPYPTIDVPFFVPLGQSFDVTVTPGMRFDWNAPRLGARLRYAPDVHTRGQMRVSWTHDGQSAMAEQVFAREVRAHPKLLQDPTFAAEHKARQALSERVALRWEHAAHHPLGPVYLDTLAHVVWLSDDLVNRDLLISPEQRVAAYLPSRGALMLRHSLFLAQVGFDGMLRLDNAAAPQTSGALVRDYSNVHGQESTTLHRAPAVQLTMLPLALTAHLSADAHASFVRYGRLRPVMALGPQSEAQQMLGGAMGLSYGRALGPFDVHGRAGVDVLHVAPEAAAAFWDAAPLTQLDVSLRLARQYAHYVHVLRPKLAYRGVDKAYAATGPVAQAAQNALDARLLRRASQQAMLVVQQSIWRNDALKGAAAQPLVSLDMGQPLDLHAMQLLQPYSELRIDSPIWGQASARISLDVRRFNTQPVRELTAQYGAHVGAVHFLLNYSRMAPDADRFQRSIYELAAPRGIIDPQSRSDWAHLLRASVDARISRTLNVHYTTLYQLPQPEQAPGTRASPCALSGAQGGASHCFVTHLIRMGYTSPCDCWGIESVLSAAPQDLLHTLRFQVLLNIAGARLGNPSSPSR